MYLECESELFTWIVIYFLGAKKVSEIFQYIGLFESAILFSSQYDYSQTGKDFFVNVGKYLFQH